MKPIISVIIPTYNAKEYIAQTIESICTQSYSQLEIIIVDDGSTDGTVELLKDIEQKDSRIKVVYKVNEGVTKTRLRGVAVATGEWITFVDADDLVERTMYERLLRNAKKYDADISHCGYLKVLPEKTESYYGTGKIVEQDWETGLSDLLKGTYIEPGLCNKLYKKLLFDCFFEKKMDESIKNNEDLLMNFYLFRAAKKSIYEDVCLYHYIARENSASTAKINVHKLCDPLKVRKILYEETLGNEPLNRIMRERVLTKLINLAVWDKREAAEWMLQYIDSAKQELKDFYRKVRGQTISKSIKVQVYIAMTSPWLYRTIHSLLKGK